MTFNRLHGIVSQKIELFIMTAVRISNPTDLFTTKTKINGLIQKLSRNLNK
jgi:hypothetical protein